MALMMIANPKKRKVRAKRRKSNPVKKVASRRTKRKVHARRRSNPIVAHHAKRKVHRRRRSNPMGVSSASLKKLAIPALIGAGSAVAINELYHTLITKYPTVIPMGLQSGLGQAAVEVALTLAVGMGLQKFGIVKNANTRNAIVLGALTGVGITTIQNLVLPKLIASPATPTATAGYQLIDASRLHGYQAGNAPSPSLGYMNSSPTVGVVSNVRDFRRSRTA